MTTEALRDLVTRLTTSAGALGALALLIDERLTATQMDPAIKAELTTFLSTIGAQNVLDGVDQEALKPVLADIRASLLQGAKLISISDTTSGWRHTEAEILRTQGEISAGLPAMWKEKIVTRLPGLQARLDCEGASFLDVGVGIAALSIAMARLWPSLRIVGIDIWSPALGIAHKNVKAAELIGRIELREQAVQDLTDQETFDLAWLPAAFIPRNLIEPAVQRIRQALRPGGWLLVATANPEADPATASFVRLRSLLWGGSPMEPKEAEAILIASGYQQFQRFSSPSSVPRAMVAARRG